MKKGDPHFKEETEERRNSVVIRIEVITFITKDKKC